MENTLKELMASFQSLQATLVTRAPLTTNPLFEGNVSMANLPITTSTLGKEPMSYCPPNPNIVGISGTKPFDLNAGVAIVQSNDQEKTQVVKLITEDEDKAIKTLKSMQGVQTNKPVDISSLCFLPNIQLPRKFKLPEFDKYNGTDCPYAHLTMCCRKMAPYANNEKLMIHYFQDSLVGHVDAWFSTLDKSKVKSWHDLTYNFMKQYEYNTALAPNREDLQMIEKKSSESFKEFAQRWRGLVAWVQPPLTDHELRVSSSKKVGLSQKKENDTGTISSVYEAYGRNNQSRPRGQFNNPFQAPTYQPTTFTSQPRPLYAFAGLVTLVPMVPVKPPFPTWYNPQGRCEYHSGGVGHDLENCLALRIVFKI
ncbi:hypothetical protein SLEP1_g39424 [Rubroshorea leprosula]|uniref:Retrotransposon gag domain-containing protein n=1 Tax=Rubroshorea leprosula TaxID=152421 RepID=A0AAV5L0J8_9ROSI|nr:hypothetical protein SLEP1_g39424 [Rubroshorea leprosula]